jgi:hypothetical protein
VEYRTLRVRDVTRDVVAKVAPEELRVVDGLTRFDDAVVVRRLRRRHRRELLGFGPGEAVTLVTAVVWIAVDEAARQAGDATASAAFQGLRVLFRKIFHRKSGPVVVPPFTSAQLGTVHEKIVAGARRSGISGNRAHAIADATVTLLVLPERQESGQQEIEGS